MQVILCLFTSLPSGGPVVVIYRTSKIFVLEPVQLIVHWTFKINCDVFEFIPRKFKNDKDFILEAIKINCDVFDFIPRKFKNDSEIKLIMNKTR